MELKILVQRKEELDADQIVEFVSSVADAKLAVFHCSINDDGVLEGFARELRERLKLPFMGVRVSATLTNDGYHENSVVVGVLSGDFKVEVHHDKLDFENPEKTIESVTSKLPEKGLCLTYAACYLTKGVYLDYILRNVNHKKPAIQFTGSLSSPYPLVFNNEGIFKKDLVYCTIEKVDYKFKLLSGFEFKKDSKEYTLTKSTDYAIQEIDNTNAVSLYCSLKHVRPYMVNMLVGLASMPDGHKLLRLTATVNKKIFEALVRGTMDLMGSVTAKDLVEPTFIFHLDEGKSEWLSQAYRPVGVILKWIVNDADKQINLYDKINLDFKNVASVLGHECAYRLVYMNFRIEDIEEMARKSKVPLMLSYGYGELGAYLPYSDVNVNVMHGVIMQVLGFK